MGSFVPEIFNSIQIINFGGDEVFDAGMREGGISG